MKADSSITQALQLHAEECWPHECVGALLGRSDNVERVLPLTNVSFTPQVSFQLTAQDYLRAEDEAERLGLSLVGLYHSHTTGIAVPSLADCESGRHFRLMVIVPVRDGRASSPIWYAR